VVLTPSACWFLEAKALRVYAMVMSHSISDARELVAKANDVESSLRLFTLENAASECVLWLTSGSMLTAWSLALGGDASTVSSIQSLMTAAQATHLPAALASSHFSRKKITLVAMLGARLAWLPLVLLGMHLGPQQGRTALALSVIASSILAMFAQNAMGSWMGDAVPAHSRGRFFAGRTWMGALGGLLAACLIATLLDRGANGDGRVSMGTMQLIAGIVVVLGVVSTALLSGAHADDQTHTHLDLSRGFALLRNDAMRRLLRYQILWGIVVAPGAAFFALHVLQTLHGGYRMLAGHGVLLVFSRLLTARYWGRYVDVHGASRTLAVCCVGIGVMPLLWAYSSETRWWPMALDALLSGVLWGGHAIAMQAHPLGVGEVRDRPFVLAWSTLALGLAWALGGMVAGAVVRELPSDALGLGPYRMLFVFSGLGRAACAYWAWKLVPSRSSQQR
jgi:MFS family permease